MWSRSRQVRNLRALLRDDGWSQSATDAVAERLSGSQLQTPDRLLALGRAVYAERRCVSQRRVEANADTWDAWASRVVEMTADLADGRSGALLRDLAATDLTGLSRAASLDIAGRLFPSELILDDVDLSGDVFLQGARVLGRLSMCRSRIGGDAYLEQSTFSEGACLDDTKFAKSVQLRRSSFGGPTSFNRVTFAQGVWARGASFLEDTTIESACFESDAAFGECQFGANVSFQGSKFVDLAGFENARFTGRADFTKCRFGAVVRFDSAVFGVAPDFGLASFAKHASFSEVVAPQRENAVHARLAQLSRRLSHQ